MVLKSTAQAPMPLGRGAADFDLKATDGRRYRLADARGPNGLMVMFICNHCPYVKGVIEDIVRDCAALKAEGIGTIAIMPNDTSAYPDDSFPNMAKFAVAHGFGFPYAIDETQGVARAYGAVCTPDFFGFDRDLKLRYRGRLYETQGVKPKPGARHELLEAMRQVARIGTCPAEQEPGLGCSIKWRGE
jgi:peroxiredoxin